MRFKISLSLCLCCIVASVAAKPRRPRISEEQSKHDSIVSAYTDSLTSWLSRLAYRPPVTHMPSPYLFRIFAPGTLYSSALAQDMAVRDEAPLPPLLPSLGATEDPELLLNEAMNKQLDAAYVRYPQFFSTTQQQLMSGSKLRSDLEQPVEEQAILPVEPITVELPDLAVEAVTPEVKRPNFWNLKANVSLQFTQNYITDNWYKGGEVNYSMLSQLTAEANFDNKQQIQWDNKLEAQLGFQTSETDEYHRFRATSNLLRFTSKFGFKASAHWNYAAQVQLESQPYMTYENNGPKVISDFLSPLYVRSSIGMDFKIKATRFEGSLYLSPLSYVITYVDREDLISRHGIVEGHFSKHEWGPNVNLNFTYKMWQNISWTSRFYWFTNFHLTLVEWENTLNFQINRYLSTKLYLYPRFDDSSIKYKAGEDHTGTYWMFKEWLSLGLNYEF